MTNKDILGWMPLIFLFALIGLFLISFSSLAEDIRIDGRRSGRGWDRVGDFSPASMGQQYTDEKDKKDDGIEIVRGVTRLELGGMLMWDYDHFNLAHIDNKKEGYHNQSESELRQARIEVKSEFNKLWKAKLQVDFNSDDSTAEIGDAYIKFTGLKYFAVTCGQDKEPFGLQEMIGSKDTLLIERSMAVNAFAPGSHPGLGLSREAKRYTWAIGVYEALDREKKRNTYALTARVVFNPWLTKKSMFHLGLAGSVRDYGREKYEIEERAEVHTAEKVVYSGKTIASRLDLLGLELAWLGGPFSLQSEYISAFVRSDTEDNATYTGYYLQGSFFLTGESRGYKKGAFEGPKPKASYGSIEIVSRYSLLDAEDNGKGVKAANLTLGGNYYLNQQVKVMGNYIITRLSGQEVEEDKARAISLRIQYSF